MNKLTTAQKQKLKPIEPFLRQSLANYLVNQTIENKEIVFTIHRQVFGGDLGKPTCPTCVLKTYRRIAELYFQPEKEQTSQDTVETPSKEEKPEVIETIKEEQKVPKKEKEHAPVKSEKTTKKK